MGETIIDGELAIELAEEAEQKDLVVAMESINEAIEDNWPDSEAVDEAIENTTMPFHDQKRELAFTMGVAYGTWLEREYPDEELNE